jgi:hypothetical protein
MRDPDAIESTVCQPWTDCQCECLCNTFRRLSGWNSGGADIIEELAKLVHVGLRPKRKGKLEEESRLQTSDYPGGRVMVLLEVLVESIGRKQSLQVCGGEQNGKNNENIDGEGEGTNSSELPRELDYPYALESHGHLGATT